VSDGLVTMNPIGPPDDVKTDQAVTYEESESLDPNAESASEFVQDVRP
jgi:hypothetical protein